MDHIEEMINFKNYEILKTISDQLRLLAWAVGGLYGYLGSKFGATTAIVLMIFTWFSIQSIAIYVLYQAQKFKDK